MTTTPEGQRLLARLNGTTEPEPPKPDYTDLVPDVDGYERTEEDIDLDRKLKDFPIVDAYTRWIPKAPPKDTTRTESIMVSCPRPDHPDADPSAWMNSKLNVGACGVCPSTKSTKYWGFDNYDLFAIHAGFDIDGYRTDGSFPELRRLMAEDLGYWVITRPNGEEIVGRLEPEPPSDAAPEPPESDGEPLATVLPFMAPEEELEPSAPFSGGPIDWRSLLTGDSTFLRPWMELCTDDDKPEEFYFWLGLAALGLACGNDFRLEDRFPVRGNLMVCLVGPSGLGKSQSTDVLKSLLKAAFPYTPGEEGGGIHIVPEPGSGEALVDSFVAKDEESGAPVGVRGLLTFRELQTLSAKANRAGNDLKGKLLEFYDTSDPVLTKSRGHGLAEAIDHFCTVVTTTQPKMLANLLSKEDADSGFVCRWMFVTGTPKPLISWGLKALDITPLIKPIKDIKSFASSKRSIILERDSAAIWDDFFRREIEPPKLAEDGDVFSRCDLLMKKLMLLFAADKKKVIVDAYTVEQVISLWPYIKKVYGLVEEKTTISAQVSTDTELENRIKKAIDQLERRGALRTDKSIRKQLGKYADKAGLKAIELAKEQLQRSGEIEKFADAKSGKPGRPPVAQYRLTGT